jgi:hypothetical protein
MTPKDVKLITRSIKSKTGNQWNLPETKKKTRTHAIMFEEITKLFIRGLLGVGAVAFLLGILVGYYLGS